MTEIIRPTKSGIRPQHTTPDILVQGQIAPQSPDQGLPPAAGPDRHAGWTHHLLGLEIRRLSLDAETTICYTGVWSGIS
jgi:hypothetical protein